jgi:hypothetical protein
MVTVRWSRLDLAIDRSISGLGRLARLKIGYCVVNIFYSSISVLKLNLYVTHWCVSLNYAGDRNGAKLKLVL